MDEPTLSSSEADAHIESTATEISLQSEIDTVKPEVVKEEEQMAVDEPAPTAAPTTQSSESDDDLYVSDSDVIVVNPQSATSSEEFLNKVHEPSANKEMPAPSVEPINATPANVDKQEGAERTDKPSTTSQSVDLDTQGQANEDIRSQAQALNSSSGPTDPHDASTQFMHMSTAAMKHSTAPDGDRTGITASSFNTHAQFNLANAATSSTQPMDVDQPIEHHYADAFARRNDGAYARDLSHKIRGLYRLLDIYSETGSGGLVDKIIIDQVSTGEFINDLCPGAYKDLTKVDFKAMDGVDLQPLGIYGSKSEIIRLFTGLNVIDETTALLLREVQDASAIRPTLRPGLYALALQADNRSERKVYIIFWPEETTWDDNAISSVRRNRTTFMRYLTKLTDQIVALISKKHSDKLVWDDPKLVNDDISSMAFDDFDEHDRLFAFEVSKANEQEESVSIRDGFTFKSTHIKEAHVAEILDMESHKLQPRLISGECEQALVTATYNAPRRKETHFSESRHNELALKTLLFAKDTALRLSKQLPLEAVQVLIKNGLKYRYDGPVSSFEARQDDIQKICDSEKKARSETITKDIESKEKMLTLALETRFTKLVLGKFPKLEEAALRGIDSEVVPSKNAQEKAEAYLDLLFLTNENLRDEIRRAQPDTNFTVISTPDRRMTKAVKKVLICDHLFSHHELKDADRLDIWKLVNEGIESDNMKNAAGLFEGAATSRNEKFTTKLVDGIRLYFGGNKAKTPDGPVKDAEDAVRPLKSVDFFNRIDEIMERWPILAEGVTAAIQIAQDFFAKNIKDALRVLPHRLALQHINFSKGRLEKEITLKMDQMRAESLKQLFIELEGAYSLEPDCPNILYLDSLAIQESLGYHSYHGYGRNDVYRCSGRCFVQTQPTITYYLQPLELSEYDRQQMKSDSRHVPKPKLHDYSYSFDIPIDSELRHVQLLANKKCLLVLSDCNQSLSVYMDSLDNLKGAVENDRHKKHFHKDKLGGTAVLAFDESKRMLVICVVDAHKRSVHIHSSVFDERFTGLQGYGSPIDLSQWYAEPPKLVAVHFLSSSDEYALVEECGRIRVFSSMTQQFRPAILQLPSSPIHTYNSPDGSCLVAIFPRNDNALSMSLYHWVSLGSREGFSFELPVPVDQNPVVSSLDDKRNIHILWIEPQENACRSKAIDIKCQVTEFQFREKNSKASQYGDKRTWHNALIDCHFDVWTRFPVVPAVRREAITFGETRRGKALIFSVSSERTIPFQHYFEDMVERFEKNSKKPTESLLKGILIQTSDFDTVLSTVQKQDAISTYRTGEWTVDFFCLIPIHIAVARDNRFIPLTDGVWSPEAEKELLGANINKVADSLSFGWYESIFQSYMSTKPVKVVSSMGEQSVGKSYALNHLTDTSFAGSAMRTTEGVWMSVTPTESDLIVSLDFEGVHSIERSAQEDTLLVLFNAAISNLVLFRNNFALSREITNLFQSFQSSSSILDPEANPTLFQSTLAIIIKDVVDSDRMEIAREFKLKLQKIVQEEQESNFISRLYRGRLNIIPWPVIESRQFYTLFSTLKRHLDNQAPTHEVGGKFLGKLKMLMAKLKTNDWGALSQNMTAHRAQQLLLFLPNALMYGATDIEPDVDALKNFDTCEIIDVPDTFSVFWLEGCGSKSTKEGVLSNLLPMWPGYADRSGRPEKNWISDLASFLEDLVGHRILHVQAWVDANLTHSGTTNDSIENLRRVLDSKIVELKRNVQLCMIQCKQCLLQCVKARFHEGDHDCTTNHSCSHSCEFLDEHEEKADDCSLPAGHDGAHICNPTAHLCGHSCDLNERRGCQNTCMKVANHDDEEHMCSSRRHYCGKPCGLQEVRTPKGDLYSCQNHCSVLWNEEHEKCVCDAMMSCPIPCQLCGRLCSVPDHLHGLERGVVHLCGQEHKCTSICSRSGVCEIDTVPQSIEATFSGAHDRFQYTKYSQVTKQLTCAVMVPAGELSHDGSHVHSTADSVFHFCDVRCANCGYICTLPHGHSQTEHSTNHGSMSKTQWAVDGPDGSILELDGHKFGSSDDGAPMLCNLVCSSMGRHTHIDYCRAQDVPSCNAPETDHIHRRVEPNPERAKDWITHKLYWRRLGFRDPYSREDQTTFAKCDAMCSGPEHQATPNNAAQPSYCVLPIFHPQAPQTSAPSGGHASNDGHAFACKNPAVSSQAFHVIFAIDRSGSMSSYDRRPLANHPAWAAVSRVADNRLGAVYSALHSFWSARATATNQSSSANRRDAYSVVLFDHSAAEVLSNDFNSSPDQLLARVLAYAVGGGTNFNKALDTAERIMQRHWSTERAPVVVFLSDGECSVSDNIVYSLCRKAVSLGKALSFHAVSFGPDGSSTWLRRMVQIAQEVQNAAPRDPLLPANAIVESSYSVALDSVRLAETFLGIADSLRKTRGGLISH